MVVIAHARVYIYLFNIISFITGKDIYHKKQ